MQENKGKNFQVKVHNKGIFLPALTESPKTLAQMRKKCCELSYFHTVLDELPSCHRGRERKRNGSSAQTTKFIFLGLEAGIDLHLQQFHVNEQKDLSQTKMQVLDSSTHAS